MNLLAYSEIHHKLVIASGSKLKVFEIQNDNRINSNMPFSIINLLNNDVFFIF